MSLQNKFSVFTKPWKTKTADEIGKELGALGFDGIELPVRRGCCVEPDSVEKSLPAFTAKLGEYGVSVFSVASSTEEPVFAACAAAGIPMIRIMADIDTKLGYLASEKQLQTQLEKDVLPLCEKYGVKVGVQNHYGNMVSSSMGLLHLLEPLDSRYIGAVWDSAHTALCGEEPELGLDIVWERLFMVNLKNAFRMPATGPETDVTDWKIHFTTGKKGLSPWRRVADYLKAKGYKGVYCLTAEYTDDAHTLDYIARDLQYAKTLFLGD